jgi:hypothetical protein
MIAKRFALTVRADNYEAPRSRSLLSHLMQLQVMAGYELASSVAKNRLRDRMTKQVRR